MITTRHDAIFCMGSIAARSGFLAFMFAMTFIMAPQPAKSAPVMSKGAGMVVVPLGGSASVDDINVWYYNPHDAGKDVPIVFVLHGLSRNADKYRDNWMALADAGRFVVLAPEFKKQHFPSSFEYNLGNVMARSDSLKPEAEWSFSIIGSVFQQIVMANDFKAARYDMFGHSAGAQFVHRYMFFMPTARVRTAVAANAGWYTLPDLGIDFPYGLRGAGVTADQIQRGLSRDLVILLGTEDNDPNGRHLRKSSEAMAQGRHRLARGENFFGKAAKAANDFAWPFNWRLEYVPGAGHSNRDMAQQAAQHIGYPLRPVDMRK